MDISSNVIKPIRVLQIVSYMQRGGLETLLMNYYRNIDRSKVQFDFIVHRSFRAAYDDEIESLGGKLYRMPRLNPFSFKYHKALDQFFEQHKEYKVAHCHLDCMSAIPLKHAKKNGVPNAIAHAHSSNQIHDFKYPLKTYYKKQIPKYADYLFACSGTAGQFMFGKEKYRILTNAINIKKYIYNDEIRNVLRTDLGITDKQFVIGHVGRFSPPKNHEFLISVFQQILEINSNARLLLVGDGVLFEKIKDLCKEKAILDKTIFTGSRPDVADLMQAMDVFVFPSLSEGLGISLIEAQTSGLQCFISDRVPSESILIPELVHRISLDEEASAWASAILSTNPDRKHDTGEIITEAGYNIHKNAEVLQNFYLDLYKKSS